jgi:hypothetical protein
MRACISIIAEIDCTLSEEPVDLLIQEGQLEIVQAVVSKM